MSFELDLQEDDLTFVATTLPYSYSRLERFLVKLEDKADSLKGLSLKREHLATTISFNSCPILTITQKRNKTEPKIRKRYICIIGRQHPCETVGSFVMEGILNFLTSGSLESGELLKRFVFKVVPMMNPDGVIYGNSRCDISGSDINRQWSYPCRDLYPVVEACKAMMIKLGTIGHDIEYFFDVHGHSKQ